MDTALRLRGDQCKSVIWLGIDRAHSTRWALLQGVKPILAIIGCSLLTDPPPLVAGVAWRY